MPALLSLWPIRFTQTVDSRQNRPKMNKLIFLTSIGLIIQGCFSEIHETNEFVLRGAATGLSDGTVLYLTDAENSQLLDSATVSSQTFEIKGELTESSFRSYIYCTDPQDARMIWLEPGTMTLNDDSTLIDAELSGSETDRISFELFKQIRSNISPEESAEILQDFIRSNPESIVSASLLSGYSRIWEKNSQNHYSMPFRRI